MGCDAGNWVNLAQDMAIGLTVYREISIALNSKRRLCTVRREGIHVETKTLTWALADSTVYEYVPRIHVRS